VAPLDDPRGATFEERERIARATLACPDLRDLVKSYSAPLTPGRFFGNLIDSVHNSTFRIPPEPADAYEKFCSGRPSRPARGG
jgi:hypothetical protein